MAYVERHLQTAHWQPADLDDAIEQPPEPSRRLRWITRTSRYATNPGIALCRCGERTGAGQRPARSGDRCGGHPTAPLWHTNLLNTRMALHRHTKTWPTLEDPSRWGADPHAATARSPLARPVEANPSIAYLARHGYDHRPRSRVRRSAAGCSCGARQPPDRVVSTSQLYRTYQARWAGTGQGVPLRTGAAPQVGHGYVESGQCLVRWQVDRPQCQ